MSHQPKLIVSSDLHLKVASAGTSTNKSTAASPALLACASLQPKMPRDITMITWEGKVTFAGPSSPLARQSTLTQHWRTRGQPFFIRRSSLFLAFPHTFQVVLDPFSWPSSTQLHTCDKNWFSEHLWRFYYRAYPNVRLNVPGKLSSHSFVGMEAFYANTTHIINAAPNQFISATKTSHCHQE